MIKRTPQEIADFFQCYVSQNFSGDWFVHMDKPVMHKGAWISHDGIGFPNQLVEAPDDHDWAILYEPCVCDTNKNAQKTHEETHEETQGYESITPDTSKSVDSPHIGEVYTHKEYHIVSAHKGIDPESFEKGVMAWVERGWKPCGGISFDKEGCPYQAMVRGV